MAAFTELIKNIAANAKIKILKLRIKEVIFIDIKTLWSLKNNTKPFQSQKRLKTSI